MNPIKKKIYRIIIFACVFSVAFTSFHIFGEDYKTSIFNINLDFFIIFSTYLLIFVTIISLSIYIFYRWPTFGDLKNFNAKWPERVKKFEAFRIEEEIPLQRKRWILLNKVAEELGNFPKLQNRDRQPGQHEEAWRKAEALHAYFWKEMKKI